MKQPEGVNDNMSLSPTSQEIESWIRRDPDELRFLMGEEAAAFGRIRTAVFRRLMREPEMWWRQVLNVVGGCCRYLGLLFVGIPTVVYWAEFWAQRLPELDREVPPELEKLRPPDIEGIPMYEESSLVGFFVALLLILIFIDVAARGRIGGFRNLFAERAERTALRVWDIEVNP